MYFTIIFRDRSDKKIPISIGNNMSNKQLVELMRCICSYSISDVISEVKQNVYSFNK